VGHPRRASGGASREHTRCGHTQFRLGGRNRSDASRVFHAGRSQDLLAARRSLARKKSAAPPDAGRGWTEGETVRVCGISKKSSHARPAGHKLAGSRYDGRRSRAHARLALTSMAKQRSSARRSTPPSRSSRTVKARPAHRADSDSDSGVPAGDNGTSEVDTSR
jgi:hypothetical protein